MSLENSIPVIKVGDEENEIPSEFELTLQRLNVFINETHGGYMSYILVALLDRKGSITEDPPERIEDDQLKTLFGVLERLFEKDIIVDASPKRYADVPFSKKFLDPKVLIGHSIGVRIKSEGEDWEPYDSETGQYYLTTRTFNGIAEEYKNPNTMMINAEVLASQSPWDVFVKNRLVGPVIIKELEVLFQLMARNLPSLQQSSRPDDFE